MQPANVATPLATVNGLFVQPLSVPPPALLAIASVTWVELSPETTLPFRSSTFTIGSVAKALPAPAPTGCRVKTS